MPTAYLIVAFVLLFCVADYALYKIGGNNWTFSRLLLGEESTQPLLGVGVAETLGTLCGHLFLPTLLGAPPDYWAHVLVVGAGVLSMAAAIVFTRDGTDANAKWLTGHPLRLGAALTAGFVLGVWFGHTLVPQHLGL